MDRKELALLAVRVEETSYLSSGRKPRDGSVYSLSDYDFFDAAISFFGGTNEIRRMTRERFEAGEVSADENCANWWLWTILNELGVSREMI
ncbi:MAG: hypothetical protein ABIJ22_03660 [Patescibacteria group bacterium]